MNRQLSRGDSDSAKSSGAAASRQHNEPAGDQAVWHYHVHMFPRYVDDELYGSVPDAGYRTPAERRPNAERLRAYFASQAARKSRMPDVKIKSN
jgi:diadenosine tetraphosphate (Ap4A) HIT family hydrolase